MVADKPIANCITDPSQDDDNVLCRASAINSRRGCFIRGTLENCNNVFSCNNGYKFKPNNTQDKDLLVTKCEEGKVH